MSAHFECLLYLLFSAHCPTFPEEHERNAEYKQEYSKQHICKRITLFIILFPILIRLVILHSQPQHLEYTCAGWLDYSGCFVVVFRQCDCFA